MYQSIILYDFVDKVEGGEYESQPIRRSDVIREEDRVDEEELPEAGKQISLSTSVSSSAHTLRPTQHVIASD